MDTPCGDEVTLHGTRLDLPDMSLRMRRQYLEAASQVLAHLIPLPRKPLEVDSEVPADVLRLKPAQHSFVLLQVADNSRRVRDSITIGPEVLSQSTYGGKSLSCVEPLLGRELLWSIHALFFKEGP